MPLNSSVLLDKMLMNTTRVCYSPGHVLVFGSEASVGGAPISGSHRDDAPPIKPISENVQSEIQTFVSETVGPQRFPARLKSCISSTLVHNNATVTPAAVTLLQKNQMSHKGLSGCFWATFWQKVNTIMTIMPWKVLSDRKSCRLIIICYKWHRELQVALFPLFVR